MKTLRSELILFISVFVSFSCHKNDTEIISPIGNSPKLTIQEAQNWFQSTVENKAKARKNQDSFKKAAFWKYAKKLESKNEDIVMIPVQYDNYMYFSNSVSGESRKDTTNLRDFDVYTTMYYMMKRNADGVIKGTLLKYIADKDYLIKNNYKKMDKFFSGTLIMSDWEEGVDKIYPIENGKIASRFPIANGRVARTCVVYTVNYYSTICINDDCSGPKHFEGSYTHQYCFDGEAPNPDAINYSTIAFGGISGPSYDYILNQSDVQAWLFNSNMYPDEKTYYITHPWLILSAMRNRNDALQKTISYYGGTGGNGNQNAFQHALWSALNTITWDDGVATFMGNMHEASGPGTQTEHNMDSFNNQLGIGIAVSLKNQMSDPKDLKRAAIDEVLNAIDLGKGKQIIGGQLVPTNSNGH